MLLFEIVSSYFMQTTQRFFLRKEHKLKSRKAIESLFSKGKSFTNFPFRVCWQIVNEAAGIKVGFTASSRNFKNATDRNRIKRLMREAYRLQKNELLENILIQQKSLHLFFIFTGKEVPTFELVADKMQSVLRKLLKIACENVE
jgi:ribonuclease P protein component